jgi:protein TonB
LAGEGEGGFGFEIDFGGKGTRKIYSYNLPEYPEGVSKEIDVKLRFTILPDGTVGKIFPLIKADARLELASINSLRQWRFEPLPRNAKQIEQTVVIIFPYRLQ